MQDHDFVRIPVVLHTISKFEDEHLRFSSDCIVKGLVLCLNGPTGLRNEMVNAPDFWFVLQALHEHSDTAQHVFDIVNEIVAGSTSSLTADNYEPVASLLNEFATLAGVTAKNDRRREQEAARNRQPRPKGEL